MPETLSLVEVLLYYFSLCVNNSNNIATNVSLQEQTVKIKVRGD